MIALVWFYDPRFSKAGIKEEVVLTDTGRIYDGEKVYSFVDLDGYVQYAAQLETRKHGTVWIVL